MICIACTTPLDGNKTKFCSVKCKNKHNTSLWQKSNGFKRKRKLVDLKGGKCSVCGYNKNLAALSFHHEENKDFGLDARAFTNTSWKKLLIEADKCIIVCQNCHMEIHYPHLDNK